MPDRNHDLSRSAVAWLATSFVLTAGLVVCSAMIVIFCEEPGKPLATAGGIASGVVLLMWLLRERPRDRVRKRAGVWGFRKRPRRRKVAFRCVRRPGQGPTTYGTNQPPDVEAIRELAQDSRTWVPSGPVKR